MSLRAIPCVLRGIRIWLKRALGLGGLWAGHALGILGVYPFFWVLRLAVSPLRRVPFGKRPKRNQKVFALTFGPLAEARGSFAPGSILAQRLRFASLHLHSLCTTASYGRCAPTPGSIPPLSLPTGSKIKIYSSLRSLLSGAASPRAAALLLLSVGASLLAMRPVGPPIT